MRKKYCIWIFDCVNEYVFECMCQRFGRVHSCWMCGLIGRMVYVGILFDLRVPKISKIMQYKWKENLRALHCSRCYNNGKLSKYHCIYQSIWMLFAHKFGNLKVCCFWKRHAIRLNLWFALDRMFDEHIYQGILLTAHLQWIFNWWNNVQFKP